MSAGPERLVAGRTWSWGVREFTFVACTRGERRQLEHFVHLHLSMIRLRRILVAESRICGVIIMSRWGIVKSKVTR
jgi:hypothetical protein